MNLFNTHVPARSLPCIIASELHDSPLRQEAPLAHRHQSTDVFVLSPWPVVSHRGRAHVRRLVAVFLREESARSPSTSSLLLTMPGTANSFRV